MREESDFIRRINLDGSYTSICRICFLTAAAAKSTRDLEAEEARHICHRSIRDETESMQDIRIWP